MPFCSPGFAGNRKTWRIISAKRDPGQDPYTDYAGEDNESI